MANPQSNPAEHHGDKKNGKGNARSQFAAELEALAAQPPPERRETFGRAFIHLVLFFAILGGVGFAYKKWATAEGIVFNTLKEARDLQKQDSVDKLLEAADKLEKAIAVKPEGRLVSLLAETDVLLACNHLIAERMADAEKYVSQASSEDVARAERYSAEGYLKVCQGQAAAAEEYMVKIMNKGATDARVFHSIGVAMLAQGKLLEAKEVFKQASDRGGGTPRYPISMGEVEIRLGNYWDAALAYGRGVNTNGNHRIAKIGKALSEGLSGVEMDKVLKDINRALEPVKAPTGEDIPASPGEKAFAFYATAELATKAGLYDNANKVLDESLKILGTRADSRHYILKGRIHLLKGDAKGAAKAWDEAAKREPLNPQVYMIPATYLVETGDGDGALAKLTAYQKAQVKETPAFFALLGDAHQVRGKADEAAKAYQQALEKEEGNVRATMGTARLLLLQKKWDDAGTLFEKVTHSQPDNGEPWYHMCGAYIEQKDFGYALQMCDKAVELYGKKGAEPFIQARTLKLAAKAADLNKDKKGSEERLKKAQDFDKMR